MMTSSHNVSLLMRISGGSECSASMLSPWVQEIRKNWSRGEEPSEPISADMPMHWVQTSFLSSPDHNHLPISCNRAAAGSIVNQVKQKKLLSFPWDGIDLSRKTDSHHCK